MHEKGVIDSHQDNCHMPGMDMSRDIDDRQVHAHMGITTFFGQQKPCT